jgi:alkanesulfonate monooxygenase SsuD/methylene tetrahydromethanopterin reductase-like flavin-dependent oxidoreductase (luciferase family)
MEVGIVQVMPAFGYPDMSDAAIYDEELRLALLADTLGFDHVWVVEHHFEDYSFCPDNFVYLAHLAARTERIRLATGAVILPWNTQPLRVAEKAALLDLLSGGRAILGIGRGLSRREFGQFGIPMEESRDRFDESAPMILEALETGVMAEHHGQYFHQPRAVIRPRPSRSFKDRVTQVAMTPDSVHEAAKLGVQMMAFNYKSPEMQKRDLDEYRAEFRRLHGAEPRPALLTDMMVCDSDAARAEENAHRFGACYLQSVLYHYELMGEHFKKLKGYDAYNVGADAMRAMGLETIAKDYVQRQIWGTPDQILRKFEERRHLMGDVGSLCAFRFGGAPFEVAERGMRLFATEVMPVLRSWTSEAESRHAAE